MVLQLANAKEKEKTIRVIEPRPVVKESDNTSVKTIRVAAYARVSTDDDEQINSLEAQKDYYQGCLPPLRDSLDRFRDGFTVIITDYFQNMFNGHMIVKQPPFDYEQGLKNARDS